MKRQIDHIVYSVPNLEEAMQELEDLTGIRPTFGGYHTTQGTKNAVVNLGNSCYLEILAIDEENLSIPAPRWMGIDFLEKPQITRWCLKSDNLTKDSQIVKAHQAEMGLIQGGQRKMTNGKLLTWEMILPVPSPQVEIVPFMTDWQHSEIHPTDTMPTEYEFLGLRFTHPDPHSLTAVLDQLNLEVDIVKAPELAIKMKMKTPNGIVEI